MDKPVALLNTKGFYDKLVSFLDYTVEQRFVRPEHRNNLLVDENPEKLLEAIENYVSLKVDSKWIDDLKAETAKRFF
jgi:hypothetical protein